MKKKFLQALTYIDWLDAGFAAAVAGIIGLVAMFAHWTIFMLVVILFSLVVGWMDDD